MNLALNLLGLLLTAALVFVGFGAVVISLFRWQIIRGEEMSIAALDQSLRSTTLSAMRGTIYDATGKVLAQSASVWTVMLLGPSASTCRMESAKPSSSSSGRPAMRSMLISSNPARTAW